MNPAEGAAEEGAVPDSEVDAFFRTGRGAAGKGLGQRRALPPPRDAGLAAATRAPPAAKRRGTEGGPCLPPRFVRRSLSARPCPWSPLPPPEDATAGLRSRRLPPWEGTGRVPAPGRHKSPAGMLGESRRVVVPAGGWAPPGARPGSGGGGRPVIGRYLEGEPVGCPAPPGRSAGRYPSRPRVGTAGGGAAGSAPRSPAAGRGC